MNGRRFQVSNKKQYGEYLKYLTRTRIVGFWGRRNRITPRLVEEVFGDGKGVYYIRELSTRPDYYIVRGDFGWDIDNSGSDPLCDHLDDIHDAISSQFGEYVDIWEHCNGRTYTKHRPFPALNSSCGTSWGGLITFDEWKNKKKKTGK